MKEVRKEKKQRSQKVQGASQTSKTTTLEDLINPAIESARMKVALRQKNEEALRKLVSERSSQMRIKKARREIMKCRIPKFSVNSGKQQMLSAPAPSSENCPSQSCFIPPSATGVLGNGPHQHGAN
uniref:Uncharacterized protein n=1 Tax=Plectus sambesii TaxID=2011161 RepID=A0A914XM41_9BILA